MNTLFPLEPTFPEGFSYIPDFINDEEERDLIKEIKKTELHNLKFQGYIANRKTASFGYDYSFDKRSLSKGKDIPAVFNSLIEKVAKHISIPADNFAELLLTEYP